MVGYGGSQLLRFAATLVLARHLLAPEVFGLVALVNVFLTGLDMLSDLGIGMDIVQHSRGDDLDFLNTAFVIQAGRGLILWLLATALAYPFALLYHQPELQLLAGIGALSVAIRGLASWSVYLMTRHVQLKTLTLLNVTAEIVGFIVSVIWAIRAPNAWALVAGRLATATVYTVGSHVVATRPIKLTWDKFAARDILTFGSGIFLSSAAYFLSGEAEKLVVGKFLTVVELGCFSLALSLASAPTQAISQVVGQVFFPMIAKGMREDRATAARHFKTAKLISLALSIPMCMGFVAYSHRLVTLMLPAGYESTGWMLQILGVRTAHQVFTSPTSSLMLACGDSRRGALASITRLVLMVGGLWLAFSKFDVHMAIAVLTISSVVGYIVVIPGVAKHLRQVLWLEVGGFALFLLSAGVATILPWPGR
jgi:O-antigen/teichoic acid export membrane protein